MATFQFFPVDHGAVKRARVRVCVCTHIAGDVLVLLSCIRWIG